MNHTNLPDYVVINDESQPLSLRSLLKKSSATLTFPLSKEGAEIAQILEEKFDNEQNCAGLAAPQIGFGKRIIVFSCPDDSDIKTRRLDLTQTMEKVIWFNPSYKPLGFDKNTDFEACFSVANLGGPVSRYKKLEYEAQLADGTKVKGVAEGFLARIIQHEIDHLNGLLILDHINQDDLIEF